MINIGGGSWKNGLSQGNGLQEDRTLTFQIGNERMNREIFR